MFDTDFTEILQQRLKEEGVEELKANDSFLIPSDRRAIPWICCVVLPENEDRIDSYSLLSGVLSTIWAANSSLAFSQRISSIIMPCFINSSETPYGKLLCQFDIDRLFLLIYFQFFIYRNC